MVKPKRATSVARKAAPLRKKKEPEKEEKNGEADKRVAKTPVRTRGRSATRRKNEENREESENETRDVGKELEDERPVVDGKKTRVRARNGRNDEVKAAEAEKENAKGEKEEEGAVGGLPMEVEEEGAVGGVPMEVADHLKSEKRGRKRAKLVKPGLEQKEEEAGTSTSRKTKRLEVLRRHHRGPGLVLTVGQGDTGQLGLGEEVLSRMRPSLVPFDKTVVDVCAGGMHTVCLTSDGEVYTFGCNDEGALGRNTSEEEGSSEFSLGKVEVPGRVVQVSAGDSHTAALTDKGEVFVWGNFRDSCGGMGLMTVGKQETRPLHILDGVEVKKIASGGDHLVLLVNDGRIFTCGCAEQGQLGRVAECFSSRGGRKGLEILLTPSPIHVAKSKCRKGFDDIWAGSHMTFARASQTGDIFACGLNNFGQLGIEVFQNQFTLHSIKSFNGIKWVQIAAGLHHTLAIDDAGQVYSLGRKEYGPLGLGKETDDRSHPVPIPKLKGVKCVEVACAVSVSYSVSSDGTGFAWGMGTNGQLGLGDVEDRWEPCIVQGKQLENRTIAVIGAGGQHAVMLACQVQSTK